MANWQAVAESRRLAATVPRKFKQARIIVHTSVHESATGIIKQVMFGARPRGRRGERGEPSPLPTSCQSCVSFVLPGREPVVRRHPRERHSVPLGSGSWRTDALRQPGGSIRPSVHPEAKAPTFLAVLRAMRASGAGPGRRGRWAFLPSFLPHGEISEISKTYFSTGRCSSSE